MRLRLSVPHYLADEDDVDTPGQLGVDLQELPDGAVLAVSRLRPGVLQHQEDAADVTARLGRGWEDLARRITGFR